MERGERPGRARCDERGSGGVVRAGGEMAMEEASFELVLNDGPDLWWLRQGRRE